MLSPQDVAIACADQPWAYPSEPPYLPHEPYAELQNTVRHGPHRNIVYAGLRRLFLDLGLHAQRFGHDDWNPLGTMIHPGERVLVKPNLVRHLHLGGGDYQAVVTHGSVIRSVLDYVALALRGRGEITVGDAPIQSADFPTIIALTGLKEVCDDVASTWNVPVRLVDFRLWSVVMDEKHRILRGTTQQGDPLGYRRVDLGKRSLLAGISGHYQRFRVTNYDPTEMPIHHNEDMHEYLVPQTVLDADVVLNLPKLKTHRKVGLTGALKNLVGINGHKDWLPHHRVGSVSSGGDEYRETSLMKPCCTRLGEGIDRAPGSSANGLRRLIIRALTRLDRCLGRDSYSEGSWYGNDTLWRTVLDLNRLLIYADRQGNITDKPQRRCLTIVDAIIAGEGEGPMEPDPRPCGLFVAGANQVAVDAVLATLVGFDCSKVPLVARAFEVADLRLIDFQLDEVHVLSTNPRFAGLSVGKPFSGYAFRSPSGWQGHVSFPERT